MKLKVLFHREVSQCGPLMVMVNLVNLIINTGILHHTLAAEMEGRHSIHICIHRQSLR